MRSPFENVFTGLSNGSVIPYLGPGTLDGVINQNTGKAIPDDSDSLILAMNNGLPMAPKLMFEFSRAAMNVELKNGRSSVNPFLDTTYRDTKWSTSALHSWLAEQNLPYIIDANRDTQLQQQYAGITHNLIVGTARISSKAYRFQLFYYDGKHYSSIDQEAVNTSLPVLFKPHGKAVWSPPDTPSDPLRCSTTREGASRNQCRIADLVSVRNPRNGMLPNELLIAEKRVCL